MLLMQYYEDIEIGETKEFGEYHVTKEEVIEFAEQYDPQPIHIDEEAAKESPFGELVASGWHIAAMCMRMLVDNFLSDYKTMGGRGVDELRWQKPVKPGDMLRIRIEILDKRVSETNPQRGYMKFKMEALNQDDEVVISWIELPMIERRNPAE